MSRFATLAALFAALSAVAACRSSDPAQVVSSAGNDIVVRRGEMTPASPAFDLAARYCDSQNHKRAFPGPQTGGGPNARRDVEDSFNCR